MELKLAATDLIKVVLKRAPAFKVGTVSVMLRDTYFGDGYFDWDWHTFSGPNIGKNIGKAVRGGPEALIEKTSCGLLVGSLLGSDVSTIQQDTKAFPEAGNKGLDTNWE